MAQSALASAGYAAAFSATAAQAQAELSGRRFPLVLAGLRLPDGDGLEVLAQCRKADPLAVGVVITGPAAAHRALEALRGGAYDYLMKPCGADSLLSCVRRGLEHHRLRGALVQKAAQVETLEKQLAMKTSFIQNVTHELKNPLSVIYGYSAFLLKQRHECKPEDLDRSLRALHNNAERLSHLLEEMLESSRLSSQKLELSRQPVPAAQLAFEAVEGFKIVAQKKEIVLRLGPVPQDPVHVDAKRVHQIFANLLSNALKFTPKGGFVVVAGRKEDGFVRFWVQDTGCGVAAQDLPRLFERFYQVSATKAHHAGLGLGLDISKGLVELHGGRIWAESVPGEGSTFFFTLPLDLHARRERAPEAPRRAVSPD